MKSILSLLLLAVPSLVSAQSYPVQVDPYFFQPVQPSNNAVINQTTDYNGRTTTTGINPYTGQVWSNTIQPNGYTYGRTANGQTYQGNVQQDPMTQMLNNMIIQGSQNVGAGLGGAFYNSQNGGQ